MATYSFHVSSESELIQAGGDHGGMQTLYLMNPNYVPYSDNNTLLLNPVNLSHAPPPPSSDHHHPLVGIPLPAPSSEDCGHLWSSIDTHMASLAAASYSAPLGLRRPVPNRQQGLSLSLSPQQVTVASTGDELLMRVPESSPSSVSVRAILVSKYLRATQELLDEVVKVEQMIKTDSVKEKKKLNRESNMAAIDHHEEPNRTTGESGKNICYFEFTTAQRQEIKIKKEKLVNMLDEVEQRYKQYHHQVQLVVSAFELAAGFGSAKSYTAVSLRTISKQFRCLKDAISTQLKATSKRLGEDNDCLGAKAKSSRLRFVDQLRQQRAFHQLGMMQHPTWRPQRGLPERAVTILRTWLFEHFLHPYPKDSDKQQLAKQTGLTRSQVSNWFINARVRLWKPMVEEIYLEDVKEQERNGSADNTSKTESKESPQLEQIKTLQAKAEKSTAQIIASPTELSNSTVSTSPMGADIGRFNPDHHQLAASAFHGNNGVSLTLGLPHCENLSLSGTHHNLLSGQNIDHLGRGLELGSSELNFCPESTGYESIDIHKRKRFSAQLLPDFVTCRFFHSPSEEWR